MNMSAPVERSKKEPKDNVASAGEPTTAANLSPNKPSVGKQVTDKQVTDKQVTDKQVTDKQVTDKQVSDKQVSDKQVTDKQVTDKQVTDKQVTDKTLAGAPAKPLDAPMHAAKGDDDIMSQPQASQRGKKKS